MDGRSHFSDMLKERGIEPEWADRAVTNPDKVEDHDDGTRHFIKQIPEFGHRCLRVVVNVAEKPGARITVFFDRRLRKQNENQSGQR